MKLTEGDEAENSTMRKSQSSMTAIGIAIVRAIESEKPEADRICYDPYARQFVNGFLFHFVRFFDRLGYSEKRGPGVMGFLTVRERHIDEYLKTCLTDGVQQVVILGAGYDARAYRFDEFKRGVKVFEVDHPATQQAKLKQLAKIFGAVPPHVTYVSIDFNTQTLEQRLREGGYDERAKTLFIWQGVTQYLTPEGVDGTLAFVAQHSTPGSAIIFDYMYIALLDGTMKHGEVSKMRRDRWLSNEVLAFGIPAGTITAFLEQRGFTQVHDANFQYLHDTYFTGARVKRTVADGYAIASAVVKPR
jgi:methyltransferase (TIGR00027 family)